MNQSIRCVFFWFVLIGVAACSKTESSIETGQEVPAGFGTINLEQGWSAEMQEKSWFTSFGSRLMPYDWFLHLEQPTTTRPFRERSYLERFGLLAAGPSALNPDGLPVGITRDDNGDGIAWVGLGCAACHTGELVIGTKTVRLDGGQSLFDFQAFENAVIEALSATVADDDKFSRLERALGTTADQRLNFRNALVARAQKLRNMQQVNQSPHPYGPGRLDAFGQIFNAVGVQYLNNSANRLVPDAPVSFPVLWSAPHMDLVQWNGSAPNAGPGPLFQNVTTAIAVFGNLEIDGHGGKLGYPSSVQFSNLGNIQNWVYQLKSPQWPEALAGAIDTEKAGRGGHLYQQHCVSCHAVTDRNDPHRKIEASLTTLEEIGTDPKAAQNFLNAKADSGVFKGRKLAIFAGPTIEQESPSIDLVMHAATGATLRHPLESARSAAQGYHKVYKAQINQHPNYYKARSLDGIWASAPYLHNGSVPTLADLLLAPDQRPKQFPISRYFDATRVGMSSSEKSLAMFDTTVASNSNVGHVYGVNLTPDQKSDLLEYLKTL